MRALLLLCCLAAALADIPVHCLYEEVKGTWTFSETDRLGNNTINCDELGEISHVKTFTLAYPNLVTDEKGVEGTWTMMYDEGFEININGRSYFAYFFYEEDGINVVSHCDQTFNGWSRDKTVRNWSCFNGVKDTNVAPRKTKKVTTNHSQKLYKTDYRMIEKINSAQNSWWAKEYPEYEKYTMEQLFQRSGGRPVTRASFPPTAPMTNEQKAKMEALPASFDWRDVDGVNYVSPVRDQKSCGSCYAFGSMGMLEARLRVATDNRRDDVFSTQDVMTCTNIAQGCSGGFNFLSGGRQALEQGVVSEECNPYEAKDEECDTDKSCSRTYVSEYEYIGGYYGATNEAEMMLALVENGPVAVALMMTNDLLHYGGGIYHYTGITNEFNPFEATDHAVLLVAYGEDSRTHEKFWTLKNSWGSDYGDDGYFNIRRGTDENAVESCAVQSTIIP